MTAVSVIAETARDVVSVTGSDAARFLQGQISQDVDSLAANDSAWSLLLAPQGKVDAWFRITRRHDDTFLIDVDAGFGSVVVNRLQRFCLRTDATFTLLSGWRMLILRGAFDTTREAQAELKPELQVEVQAEVTWPAYSGIDLLGPELTAPTANPSASPQQFEAARIRAGWPRMGRELTERTIPAEIGGLVEVSVSFTKGCYTGQELVARIDSRGGNVPRPLRLLEISGCAEVPVGTAVNVDGEKVGEITSAALDLDQGVTVALAPVHRRIAPRSEAEVAGAPAKVLPTPASAASTA